MTHLNVNYSFYPFVTPTNKPFSPFFASCQKISIDSNKNEGNLSKEDLMEKYFSENDFLIFPGKRSEVNVLQMSCLLKAYFKFEPDTHKAFLPANPSRISREVKT